MAWPRQRQEEAWCCGLSNLVVLQQDEAEIELAEGELQVLDVVVLAALLL